MAFASDWEFLDWVNTPAAWVIAGLFSLTGLCLSLYNIYKHIYNYTKQDQQLYIIRILFIVPLYAVVSFLSLRFHEQSLYFEIFRDCYEAFVIYCFLVLILSYCGGESNCVALLTMKAPMSHPCPCCCLPKFQMNVRFLRFCKQSVIQFIVQKPVMAVISLILLATDNYWDEGYQVFLLIVYNISYSLALYGLFCFYLAMRDDIRAFSPVLKFLAVKIVIFATYWQSVMISIIPGVPNSVGNQWNDFILCCEMSFFAFIHYKSFPWFEFRSGLQLSKSELLNNTKSVLSFKDVFRDVYHNVMPTYQTYVIQNHDDAPSNRSHPSQSSPRNRTNNNPDNLDNPDNTNDDSADDLELGQKSTNNSKGSKTVKMRTYMYGNLDDPRVHNRYMFRHTGNSSNSANSPVQPRNHSNNSSTASSGNGGDVGSTESSRNASSAQQSHLLRKDNGRDARDVRDLRDAVDPRDDARDANYVLGAAGGDAGGADIELKDSQLLTNDDVDDADDGQVRDFETLTPPAAESDGGSDENAKHRNDGDSDGTDASDDSNGSRGSKGSQGSQGSQGSDGMEREQEDEAESESEYEMKLAVTERTFEQEEALRKKKQKVRKMQQKRAAQQKRKEQMDKFKDKMKEKLPKRGKTAGNNNNEEAEPPLDFFDGLDVVNQGNQEMSNEQASNAKGGNED